MNNIPNKLTMIRVILIPFFIVFMLWDAVPYGEYIAAAVFILACITDFFDGYLARKYNETTTFGKFMDPLADKLLVCSALICFAADPECVMPAWAVIVIIAREFIISGFRLIAVEKGVVIAANYWGKVKTVVQMVMSIVLILDFSFSGAELLEWILIWAAVVLTVISLLDYIYKNRAVLSDTETRKKDGDIDGNTGTMACQRIDKKKCYDNNCRVMYGRFDLRAHCKRQWSFRRVSPGICNLFQ